jgi:outer membrane protein assembly factor BamE (lipoprotein component of BamABCDE complex)
MVKLLYIIILSLIVSNCTVKKVVKYHGVPFLKKKQELLKINESNKNDILNILGSPSTRSKFDNDLWIYIEQNQSQSQLKNLGKLNISKNNILVLELNNYGILKKKQFLNKKDMKKIVSVKETTETGFTKNSFIYDFLSSMRQKINDPLGVRAKKRKEINQR